jgi:hypothetical protein
MAHKTQFEFRSHFLGEKSASYGPGNAVCIYTAVHTCWTLVAMCKQRYVDIQKYTYYGAGLVEH